MQEWLAYAHYHFAEHEQVCLPVARLSVCFLSSVSFIAAHAAGALACTTEGCKSLLPSSSSTYNPQTSLQL